MTGTSVRALCGVEELSAARVVGGHTGLDREVASVTAISSLAAAASVGPGAFVIAAPAAVQGNIVDVLLRAARAGGAAAFLVPDSAWVVASTARLADKLGTPLIVSAVADPLHLALQLDRVVRAPELHHADVLMRLFRRLGQGPVVPQHIVAALADLLSAPVALLGAGGTVLASQGPLPPPELLAEPRSRGSGVVRLPGADGEELMVTAVSRENGAGPELWLAVRLPPGPRSRAGSARDAALLASWALSAWVAAVRLEGERDARERTRLLSALMERPGVIDRRLAERVLRAGWRLDGWHTGVYVRVTEPGGFPLARYTGFLQGVLAEAGLRGPLVERSAGWALWLTDAGEPSGAAPLVTRLKDALAGLDLPLIAGVGRPHPGAEGIALSLHEAHQASLLASAGACAGRREVAHIDELGVQRLLADWYTSESFQTYARGLLDTLRGTGGESLLSTVESYLEHESSTSTTAGELGVHRNTVSDRITRAERLLGLDLSDPDDRLVLQLACRTYRLSSMKRDGDGVAATAI
ncbi:PucR family transcriptional regulator [Actinomadura chibensis]|uniref:PucR family transcriptional regulator n=1 Tax=Actinomadura chibensis TaxID=392828 RepID=A0A5D0NM97_9ACTN|nr:helix-turn-helix domain-containing protein [Actinomadura chibensis]TYB45582.1 PucR family transcriptional regulator [Actinomadura chibensis]